LTERTVFGDDAGQLNSALLDYKLQTAADAPAISISFVETFTPNMGPYGAKPIAEAPNVATAAAISNAIAKLAGRPVRQLPMTAERIWAEMQTETMQTETMQAETIQKGAE
jgi:CO/xanthine dehydrogenase Mo-binding subunit